MYNGIKISNCLKDADRRKIRLIEGNAKCRHLKNWPVNGLCGRLLIRVLVYIQSCGYFQPSFGICTLLCCPSPLLSGSTPVPLPPLPCVNKYTVSSLQCVGGGEYGASDRKNPAAKSFYRSIFLDDDILLWCSCI
jgi:hypothetical protein